MMLRTPKDSICFCASSLAPSAIANMTMTDATPNTKPKTVRKERNLCRLRLRIASPISGNVVSSVFMRCWGLSKFGK